MINNNNILSEINQYNYNKEIEKKTNQSKHNTKNSKFN